MVEGGAPYTRKKDFFQGEIKLSSNTIQAKEPGHEGGGKKIYNSVTKSGSGKMVVEAQLGAVSKHGGASKKKKKSVGRA